MADKDNAPATLAATVLPPTPALVPTTKLTIEGKDYDLKINLPLDSKILVDARSDVSEGLELSSLVTDLKATSDLLFVAACGVAGSIHNTELPGKVANIRYSLLTAFSETDTAMAAVHLATETILANLRDGFGYLYRSPPREDMVLEPV